MASLIGLLLLGPASAATTTPGTVTLTGTISDYVGTSSTTGPYNHFSVAYVTKADGTFIKTLWRQGPDFTSKEWGDHTSTYNNRRAGSVALDGVTVATATSYAGLPNNPISLTWNCRDAAGNMMEDGDYNFYIQYAESQSVSGVIVEGPQTTALTWTKGATPVSLTPPNQGTQGVVAPAVNNFTNLSIVWTPATVAPSFTSTAPHAGSQGTPYNHTCTATGSPAILYSVTAGALPTGLTMTSTGVISGTPIVAGLFSGTITADNGMTPATQSFSINIAEAIVFTNTVWGNGNPVTAYTHTCTVIGTPTVTFSLDSGMLPPGLTISTDGLISGTPTEVGEFTGKIKAHNGKAPDVTQDFSIVISTATDGAVTLTATINDYAGNATTAPTVHAALVWVTDANGKFIKTLWKQGKATFDPKLKDWDHFAAWNTARNGSDAFDGFTSATALDYASPNSPISVTWNCRDAKGNLVDDGDYKFFIQYCEYVSGGVQGVLSSGLVWTKGLDSGTVMPPAEGATGAPVNGNNFTNMTIEWDSNAELEGEIVVQEPVFTNLLDGNTLKDFGSTQVNTAGQTKTFTIKNVGTIDLSGLAIQVYGLNAADFAIVSPPAQTTIAPWTSTTFTVAFNPLAVGARTAALQILSSDVDEGPFDIQLSGTATAPPLPPAPEIVVMQPAGSSLVDGTAKKSFGTVKLGKSGVDKTFTIKNTGTAKLSGLKILKNGASPYDFRVSMLDTHSLEAGKSTTFKVSFKPSAKGTRNATIYIMSDDADENPFSVKLTGQAVK